MIKPLNISEVKTVAFRYLKEDAETSATYTLTDRLTTWDKDGITYYKGWCIERAAPRMLRSDRIVSYSVVA
jgi:predicted DNA-binding transcriptional regulator YafY